MTTPLNKPPAWVKDAVFYHSSCRCIPSEIHHHTRGLSAFLAQAVASRA
jgi:hypothetical protein